MRKLNCYLFSALTEAMSLRKLGFFGAGIAATAMVAGLLLGLAAWSRSIAGVAVVMSLVGILLVGMPGVLAGGVAYMIRSKAEGRPESVRESLKFCSRRFLSLFGGMLLVVTGLGLISVLVNGIVALLAGIPGVSLLAALLLIPQTLFNLVLSLAGLTAVLVPCAIASRDIGALDAIRSVVGVIRRDTAPLLVHAGLALFVGGVLSTVLLVLLTMGLAPTLSSNGPDIVGSLFDEFAPPSSRGRGNAAPSLGAPFGEGMPGKSRIGSQSVASQEWERMFQTDKPAAKQTQAGETSKTASALLKGDWLRLLSLIALFLAAVSYPSVFWICAMSAYGDAASRDG